jgi:hypothetical protein
MAFAFAPALAPSADAGWFVWTEAGAWEPESATAEGWAPPRGVGYVGESRRGEFAA